MRYVVLIYHNPESLKVWESLSADERHAGLGVYRALNEDLEASGELVVTPRARPSRPGAGASRPPTAPGCHRRPVRRGQGAPGRVLPAGVRERRTCGRDRGAGARGRPGAGRGAARSGPQRVRGMSTATGFEDLLRELAPQVLTALVRRFGGFDTCEDAVQEALLAAAVQWPVDGLPDNPQGLADHHRVAAADRAVARRHRPQAPRGDGRRDGPAARRAPAGRRRHADAADAVLPPVAHPGLAGGADAARGRRADDRGDRPRVPRAGSRRSRSGSAGPSSGSSPAAGGSGCRRRTSGPSAWPRSCTSCT